MSPWRSCFEPRHPDTVMRLAKYFGQSERFWLNMQALSDLEVEKDKLEGRLENEVKVLGIRRLVYAGIRGGIL